MNEIRFYQYDIVIAKYNDIMIYMTTDDKGNIKYRLEDLSRDFQERVVNDNSSLEDFYKYIIKHTEGIIK